MATVKFDNATRIYPGNDKPSVDKLNIDIEDGEFLVLVGPSGCGKSTSLRMLAGLGGGQRRQDLDRRPRRHRPLTQGPRRGDGLPGTTRSTPHMSVADNMGFALKIAGTDKAEIRKRVEEAAKILDLTQYLDRKPKALSGGQRQRVAMGPGDRPLPAGLPHGRAAVEPRRQARVQTRTQIASLQRRLGVTTVYAHPRPGRGHDDGRPYRPAQGRPAPAVRDPARDVRPPGEPLRRRLHRLPAMNLLSVP